MHIWTSCGPNWTSPRYKEETFKEHYADKWVGEEDLWPYEMQEIFIVMFSAGQYWSTEKGLKSFS